MTAGGWSLALVAPPADEGDRVGGLQTSALMYESAMRYVVDVFGVASNDELAALPIRPVLRGMSSQFESELLPETAIVVSCRARSRSSRSFVLEHVLSTRPDDRVVATGTVSLVVVDVAAGAAVAIPDEVLARMQEADGRPVPTESRS